MAVTTETVAFSSLFLSKELKTIKCYSSAAMVIMAAIMRGMYSSDIFFLTTIVDYEVYLVCDKAFR